MSASFPESGHANLSALQVIGSSVASLLGPVKGVKCLFDEDSNEGLLVTSTNELLHGLDIEHPVGQLAREFCLSQHKRHGSSCTTLVTLAGLWAANVQSLLNQDVPIQDIIRVGDEFLQECEGIAEQCTISIHSLSKPATVASGREENGDGMILYDSSTLLESSNSKDHHHHCDITRSEVTEMDSVGLNQNSNNSCALTSQTTLKSASLAGSGSHENTKHTVISDLESAKSSPLQEHAIPFLSASSAKTDTSSAILKDDDDDVSWFFDNGSQYDDRAEDITSTAAGKIASKHEDFTLHGHQQKDSSRGEKLMEEEDVDDVEWFFEEDAEINRMRTDSCDALHAKCNDTDIKTIASSVYAVDGKDVCLEVTDLKETVKQRAKNTETTLQPPYGLPPLKSAQDSGEKNKQAMHMNNVHSIINQRQQVSSQESSSTRIFPFERSAQLNSLLKSALDQKPSKPLKGSRRILSRHLLADEQDTWGFPGASDMPVKQSVPIRISSDHGHHHLTDEKKKVVPTSTLRATTSDHLLHRDAMKSFGVPNQNEAVPGMLADDVMRTQKPTMKAEESHTIAALGDSLSHGAVAEMKLAIEACQAQLIASQEQHRFAFSPELVHVQTLTGPPSSSSCCIHGLVLPVHENQLNTLHTITGRSMTGLLLNSDVQESYRHRGFKNSLKSSSTVSGVPTSGTAPISAWTDRVLSVLKKLNVDLLMVHGSVDSFLVDACCFHNILILDHVPYRLLQILATVHKSNLLTYIPDALQDDVCENIEVSYWSSGYDPHPTVRSRDLKIQHHVRIVCPGDVMTIVLCAPSAPHLAGVEHRLHSCLARLRGAVHDGKVLLGGGRIEQHLVEKFSHQNEYPTNPSGNDLLLRYHHGIVYKTLAQGFVAYIQHTQLNKGQHPAMEDTFPDSTGCHGSPSSDVHDCFSAKKGAWQKAWHLVKQVLLCDALIVTGVDKGDKHLNIVL